MKKLLTFALFLVCTMGAFAINPENIKVNSIKQRLPWNGIVDVNYTISNIDTTHAWDLVFVIVKNGDTIPVQPISYTCKKGTNEAVINLSAMNEFNKNEMGEAILRVTLVDKGAIDVAAELAALETEFAGKDLDDLANKYGKTANADWFMQEFNKYSYLEIDSVGKRVVWKYYLMSKPLSEVDSFITDKSFFMEQELFADTIHFADGQKIASAEVPGLMTVITTIISLYPSTNDEINRCLGLEANPAMPIASPDIELYKKLFGTFPVKKYGLLNMGAFTFGQGIFDDLSQGKWSASDFDNNGIVEMCRCVLQSDVLFKAVSKLIEALQVSNYPWTNGQEGYDKVQRLKELRGE